MHDLMPLQTFFWGLSFLPLAFVLLVLILGWISLGVQKKVWVQHTESGLVKKGYVGFCWTYLFFGWLVPIFRGELLIGVLHGLLTFLTLGVFQVIMPFLYNRQYMTRLLTSGWVLCDDEATMDMARRKLNIRGT